MLSTPVKFNAPISKVTPEPLKHKTTIQSSRTENKELKNNVKELHQVLST